jgi:tetratricopeptide (TPR) repeat protein
MVDEHHPHLVPKLGVWQRPASFGAIPAAGVCIRRWLEQRQCCPLCNKIFSKDDNLSIEYIRVMREGSIIEINAIIKKLTLCEQSANILNMLSELYKLKGLNDKAEQTLKLSIKKFPSDTWTYFNLAKFYTDTNQRHLARKHHESCLGLLTSADKYSESEYIVLLNFAAFLVQTPKMPEISQDFGKLVKAKTTEKKLQMVNHARSDDCTRVTTDDEEHARRLLNRILEINPKCYKAYILLAKLVSNIEEELRLYSLAIEHDDDNSPLANYRVATILLKLDRYTEATDYYKTALELDKSLIEERISYFFGLISIGNIKEGIQRLKEILDDYPNCIKVQNLLKLVDQHKEFLTD